MRRARRGARRSSPPAAGPGAGCSTRTRCRRRRVHVAQPGVDRADPAPGTPSGRRAAVRRGGHPGQGARRAAAALATSRTCRGAASCVGSLDRDPGFVASARRAGQRRPASPTGCGSRDRCTGAELDAAYADADLLVLPSRARDLRHGRDRGAGPRAAGASPPAVGGVPGGARPRRRRDAGPASWCPPDDPWPSPRPCAAGSPTPNCAQRLAAGAARAPDDPAGLADTAARISRRPRGGGGDDRRACRRPDRRTVGARAGRCRDPRRPGLAAGHRAVPRRPPRDRRRRAGRGRWSIGVLTTVCCAWRWSLVARGLGRRAAAARRGRRLLPLAVPQHALPGGVLGDVHRAVRHGRDVGDLGPGLRAVVWERVAGQVVQVVLAVVVLLLLPSPVRAVVPRRRRRLRWPAGVAGVRRWPGGARAVTVRLAGAASARGRGRRPRRRCSRRRRGPASCSRPRVVVAGHLAIFLVAARAAGSTASPSSCCRWRCSCCWPSACRLNIAGWGPREGVAAWAFAPPGWARLRASPPPSCTACMVLVAEPARRRACWSRQPARRATGAAADARARRTGREGVRAWLTVPTPCSAAACRSTATSTATGAAAAAVQRRRPRPGRRGARRAATRSSSAPPPSATTTRGCWSGPRPGATSGWPEGCPARRSR